jgi:hypothetical protein
MRQGSYPALLGNKTERDPPSTRSPVRASRSGYQTETDSRRCGDSSTRDAMEARDSLSTFGSTGTVCRTASESTLPKITTPNLPSAIAGLRLSLEPSITSRTGADAEGRGCRDASFQSVLPGDQQPIGRPAVNARQVQFAPSALRTASCRRRSQRLHGQSSRPVPRHR